MFRGVNRNFKPQQTWVGAPQKSYGHSPNTCLQIHRPSPRSILKKCDPLSSAQPRERLHLSVHFNIVDMREFNRAVGDNPSVSRGLPIALGWNYNPTPIIQGVDEYKLIHEPRRSKMTSRCYLPGELTF